MEDSMGTDPPSNTTTKKFHGVDEVLKKLNTGHVQGTRSPPTNAWITHNFLQKPPSILKK